MNDPKKHDNANEWRLVPMVNLVSLIVPTVLMGGWVLTGGWHTLATDASVAPDVLDASGGSHLDLAVHITPSGFEIAGDDGLLRDEGHSITVSCSPSPCESSSDYDVAELQRRLHVIKNAHPTQADITLVPHADTPFGQLMDLRRAVSHSTSEIGEAELFPWVSISESR